MHTVPGRRFAVITLETAVAIGCAANSGLDRLSQARESRMAASEAAARNALEALGPVVPNGSSPALAAAAAALNRSMAVHSEVTALSRRNTDVHSLALTLNQKGQPTRACEESLRALRDALARRGVSGTR